MSPLSLGRIGRQVFLARSSRCLSTPRFTSHSGQTLMCSKHAHQIASQNLCSNPTRDRSWCEKVWKFACLNGFLHAFRFSPLSSNWPPWCSENPWLEYSTQCNFFYLPSVMCDNCSSDILSFWSHQTVVRESYLVIAQTTKKAIKQMSMKTKHNTVKHIYKTNQW